MDPAPPIESEVRLYLASGGGLVEVARLNAVAPPLAAEGALDALEFDGDHVGDAGLLIALVQGGNIVDVARLVFCGGEPSDADGGADCYSSNPSTSDDSTPSSRSRSDEKVSAKKFGALSFGRLVGIEEGKRWELEGVGAGEPSDADGGSDCYSSDPSTSGDSTPSSRSRSDEEVSEKQLGALSFGGLVGIEEGKRWELEGAGEDDVDRTSGEEDDDPSDTRAGQACSSFWSSGNYDSTSDEEDKKLELVDVEHDQELKGRGKAEVDLTSGIADVDLSSTRSGHARSRFWRSGSSYSSTSDEEENNQVEHIQELKGWGEDDVGLTGGEEESSSNTRSGQARSSFWRSGNYDSTSDEEEQNQELNQDNDQSTQINLRLWPAQKHALIKVFCGGKWVLTKDYGLMWLNLEDVLQSILKVEFGASFANVLGFRNTICTMDFQITVDSSPKINDLITVIKPSVQDFQILKKVGGEGACKVFKCLFMGSKCALKALTQKSASTLEPREIDIISNLKDTHVMVFYEAWTEHWAYRGRREKEYIFIHVEFCQSTLKHALLKKNIHWFPNKWHLFEEIVRSVCRLHDKRVVHRDLKPDNIFFNSEMNVCIGDFGDACVGRDEFGYYGGGTPKLGTWGYIAPELNSGGKVTEKADVYSVAVILFEIFAMFDTRSEKMRVFSDLSKKGPPDSWGGDRELYDMMTALEPNDRPTAAEVLDYIRQHHSEG